MAEPVEPTKDQSKVEPALPVVRRLFSDSFNKEHRRAFAFAVFCMIVTALATAATAWLMRDVINEVFYDSNASKVWLFGSAVMGVFIVKGLSAYGEAVTLDRIGNAITRDFQTRIIGKIASMSAGYFESNHSSRLLMRISQNSRAMAGVVILVSTSLGRNLLTLLALIGVMVAQDLLMSLIVLVLAPLVVFGVKFISGKIRELDSDDFASTAAVLAGTQETFRGIRTVKAFALEEEMQGKVEDAARGAEARRNAISKIKASIGPFMESLGGLAIGFVIFYAGWQTIVAGKTPGEFMAFLTAFLLAYEPAKRLARFNVSLQQGVNRTRMVYELLDSPNIETDKPDAQPLARPKGAVKFENVSFRYERGKAVLKKLSFEASAGKVTALVGPSGAGKSTVFNLIQRLYEPAEGKVSIDGKDIADLTLESLRSHISLVAQDTFLLSGTIRENIAYGNRQASGEEVRAAAEAARVTEFSDKLREGLDTQVGENGMKFSGGQRQRIAVARALLKDAPILLLDEATSALDNESDQLVRSAISELTKGRTTIVIAHRLSTIVSADQIYFVESGTIAQSGSHTELMAAGGEYSSMFRAGRLEIAE